MLDGVKVNCLLDSGAEVSTLTEYFFSNTSGLVDTTPWWLRITAANGRDIHYRGYVEFDLGIGGRKFPGMGFLVVRDLDDPEARRRKQQVLGIFGSNIIRKLSEELQESDLVDSSAELAQVLRLYSAPLRQMEATNGKRQLWKIGLVKTRETIGVLSRSMMVIVGTGNQQRGTYNALVEQVDGWVLLVEWSVARDAFVIPSFSKTG